MNLDSVGIWGLEGDDIMASNFTIRSKRKNGNLHIKLIGDFDGSSAHVLLNALKRNSDGEEKIFVHTGGLRRVSPFGRDVLQSHLSSLKNKSARIIFTGENGAILAPERI